LAPGQQIHFLDFAVFFVKSALLGFRGLNGESLCTGPVRAGKWRRLAIGVARLREARQNHVFEWSFVLAAVHIENISKRRYFYND
jgi:hypothetical protein